MFIVESGETAIRGVGIYVRKELMAEEVKVITKFQESIYTTARMDYAKSARSQGEIPNLQPKETKFRCAEHQIEEKKVTNLQVLME